MDIDKQNLKFAADRMLGKLARWLRLTGQDVIYGPHLCGYGLIRAARQEGRLILTRDRRLKQKQPPEFLFIESDHYREQLRQVIRVCNFEPLARAFTRCAECNAVLQSQGKAAVETLVPPYVFSTQERFFACPHCRRIYWPATHHEQILAELKKINVSESGN
jgi:uncharacterized protein with PIN domain